MFNLNNNKMKIYDISLGRITKKGWMTLNNILFEHEIPFQLEFNEFDENFPIQIWVTETDFNYMEIQGIISRIDRETTMCLDQ